MPKWLARAEPPLPVPSRYEVIVSKAGEAFDRQDLSGIMTTRTIKKAGEVTKENVDTVLGVVGYIARACAKEPDLTDEEARSFVSPLVESFDRIAVGAQDFGLGSMYATQVRFEQEIGR